MVLWVSVVVLLWSYLSVSVTPSTTRYVVPAPGWVTVTEIARKIVDVRWEFSELMDNYVVVYQQVGSQKRTFVDVPSGLDHLEVSGLVLKKVYTVHVFGVYNHTQTPTSESVTFILEGKETVERLKARIQAKGFSIAEPCIGLLVLIIWGVLVYIFFKQWGAIRNLPPIQKRYNTSQPANETHVDIVADERASEIVYKDGHQGMKDKFKRARQKRLSELDRESMDSTF